MPFKSGATREEAIVVEDNDQPPKRQRVVRLHELVQVANEVADEVESEQQVVVSDALLQEVVEQYIENENIQVVLVEPLIMVKDVTTKEQFQAMITPENYRKNIFFEYSQVPKEKLCSITQVDQDYEIRVEAFKVRNSEQVTANVAFYGDHSRGSLRYFLDYKVDGKIHFEVTEPELIFAKQHAAKTHKGYLDFNRVFTDFQPITSKDQLQLIVDSLHALNDAFYAYVFPPKMMVKDATHTEQFKGMLTIHPLDKNLFTSFEQAQVIEGAPTLDLRPAEDVDAKLVNCDGTVTLTVSFKGDYKQGSFTYAVAYTPKGKITFKVDKPVLSLRVGNLAMQGSIDTDRVFPAFPPITSVEALAAAVDRLRPLCDAFRKFPIYS